MGQTLSPRVYPERTKHCGVWGSGSRDYCMLTIFSYCEHLANTWLFHSFVYHCMVVQYEKLLLNNFVLMEITFNNILTKVLMLPCHSHTSILHLVSSLHSLFNVAAHHITGFKSSLWESQFLTYTSFGYIVWHQAMEEELTVYVKTSFVMLDCALLRTSIIAWARVTVHVYCCELYLLGAKLIYTSISFNILLPRDSPLLFKKKTNWVMTSLCDWPMWLKTSWGCMYWHVYDIIIGSLQSSLSHRTYQTSDALYIYKKKEKT